MTHTLDTICYVYITYVHVLIGLLCARQAVAKHHTTPEAPLTENVTFLL